MNENKNLNTAAKIRLLVLDIDGTVADKTGHIRKSIPQAICAAEERGVATAIATGRGFQLSLPTYRSIGSTLPLICYGGALIKEPDTGTVHRHWSLGNQVAVQL